MPRALPIKAAKSGELKKKTRRIKTNEQESFNDGIGLGDDGDGGLCGPYRRPIGQQRQQWRGW